MSEPELLVIVGPTASGKTELALKLARQTPSEIVSADSVQVYRELEIGTGKPRPEERELHHLIDIRDPHDPLDAAQWAKLADMAIADIRARGRLPIVCGGTFLWIKALLFGLAPAPPGDEKLREVHRSIVSEGGRSALHERLRGVDAESAARLNPNDFMRVSRALEVFELTGVPMSAWQKQHGFSSPRYRARLLGIGWAHDDLDRRIRQRTERMFELGFVDEVRELLQRGYGSARAMRSVGYRQIADVLTTSAEPFAEAGPVPASADRQIQLVSEPPKPKPLGVRDASAPDLRDLVYRATRVFARRQRTWLRDQPVEWLSPTTALGDQGE